MKQYGLYSCEYRQKSNDTYLLFVLQVIFFIIFPQDQCKIVANED